MGEAKRKKLAMQTVSQLGAGTNGFKELARSIVKVWDPDELVQLLSTLRAAHSAGLTLADLADRAFRDHAVRNGATAMVTLDFAPERRIPEDLQKTYLDLAEVCGDDGRCERQVASLRAAAAAGTSLQCLAREIREAVPAVLLDRIALFTRYEMTSRAEQAALDLRTFCACEGLTEPLAAIEAALAETFADDELMVA